ncbi:cytochrome P450 [Streptomyces sp. NPDC096030]|uniref:cytochrome P450 n=1 Tax=Streptomyces sp. NPDC096030 TaxID=3155423 RepID=UPI0033304FD3
MTTTPQPTVRAVEIDSTVPLLVKGYGWLPDLRRRVPTGDALPLRIFGRRGVALHGEGAVAFFYDEQHVRRDGAVPGPVLDTLFGRGAVHTLDGEEHRVRKNLFQRLLKDPERVVDLVKHAQKAWDEAEADWQREGRITLFERSALLLTRAVHAWAGIPLPDQEAASTARDLVAMVDGFAAVGPRHLRARRARKRQEARLTAYLETLRYAGAPSGRATIAQTVDAYTDVYGRQISLGTAAVELLNVLRPTVAVSWYLTFAAHALHRWPEHRERVAADEHYALAFAQEVRRFYPFAPFVAGLAAADIQWNGISIPRNSMVLLDLYGHDHDPALWRSPYTFDPGRFITQGTPSPALDDKLIPQGGGDPATGHRCPGEDITIALIASLAPRLARLPHDVPDQDLSIPLNRVPTRPRSGNVMDLRTP